MRINSWNVIDIVTDIRLVKWLKLTTLSPLTETVKVKLEFFFYLSTRQFLDKTDLISEPIALRYWF